MIGMASADVLKQHNDEVTWTECSNDTCGEQYFHANMHPANSEANNFAVVPVAIDVRPNWYVAGCDALRVAPRLAYIDTNAYVFLPRGVECAPITLYLTHKAGGTSLALDYLAANEIEPNSESCGGRPGAMQGRLCGIRVKEQRNFSLDLQHAIEQEGGSMALGNWALHVDAAKWRMLECEGCRPRDLVLVVPIRNETGWRPPASVCAAIKHLRGKLETSVERFVDFEECGAAVAAEHCRCKLTAGGEKLRLRLDNRVRPERRNHEL